MQLKPSEISDLIRQRLESYEATAEARTEGTIVSLADGIARIYGLDNVMQGEMIEFPAPREGDPVTYGLAMNLERDSVGAVILGDYEHLAEGDKALCTGLILEVPVAPPRPARGPGDDGALPCQRLGHARGYRVAREVGAARQRSRVLRRGANRNDLRVLSADHGE